MPIFVQNGCIWLNCYIVLRLHKIAILVICSTSENLMSETCTTGKPVTWGTSTEQRYQNVLHIPEIVLPEIRTTLKLREWKTTR